MQIRQALVADSQEICLVHLSAFPDHERESVARLAADLLRETTQPETIAWVVEVGGMIVGHIAFSPVFIDRDPEWKGYLLGPLGIKPEFHRQGMGSQLVSKGKTSLADRGISLLFVYGDPLYYGKFGFSAETASAFLPPYQLAYPFGWQALVLNGKACFESREKLTCVVSLCYPELW